MTDPTRTADALVPFAHIPGKPVLAAWMGGQDVAEGARILSRAGIPTFPYPDTAVEMFNDLWRSAVDLRGLYETPVLPDDAERAIDRAQVAAIIDAARADGRTLLTEVRSKAVLAGYGIPITETRIARTPDEAVTAADAIGYPVVVKLYSHTITHKTDVGGVRLNLVDADAVRAAWRAIEESVAAARGPEHFEGVTVQPMINYTGYELIVGSSIDPQVGPVLLFGMGGQLVELFRDRALGLPPLNTTLARRMIERTTIAGAFRGLRGRAPIDTDALERLLVQFSLLVVEQRWIRSSTSTRCSPRPSGSSPWTRGSCCTTPGSPRPTCHAWRSARIHVGTWRHGPPPMGRRSSSARSDPRTNRRWSRSTLS